MFFRRMASNVRLLFALTKFNQNDTLVDEPQLLQSLWHAVQDVMDDLRAQEKEYQSMVLPKQRAMVEFSMQGVLFLSNASALCPHSFRISEDDLILCIDYALWLWDHDRCKTDSSGVQGRVLWKLVCTLSRQAIDQMGDHDETFMSGEELQERSRNHAELCQYLDLLLDALRDGLVAMANNAILWKALSEFHGLLSSISSTLNETSGPSTSSTRVEIRKISLNSTLLNASHFILVNSLLQRWCSQVTQSDWFSSPRQWQSEYLAMEVPDTCLWEETSLARIDEEVGDDEEQGYDEGSPDQGAGSRSVAHARWLWMMGGAANDILSILKLQFTDIGTGITGKFCCQGATRLDPEHMQDNGGMKGRRRL
ncbi:hypothetical protein BGX34_010467 [Mortierella sp. NVP85]|nr:hypothetical protein BGX34_010467 [Mortierella sp. NVP85]